jgi:hypothetical protein
VRFSFIDLGLNRVVVNCAVDNTRSRAIPERLGFNLEATLREREVGVRTRSSIPSFGRSGRRPGREVGDDLVLTPQVTCPQGTSCPCFVKGA